MKLAPFVLIPSLIQFQWREDGPPRYMAVGRMLDQFMTDLGIFDPYYHDELNNPAAYKDEPAYVIIFYTNPLENFDKKSHEILFFCFGSFA